jgi:hypothetical protein
VSDSLDIFDEQNEVTQRRPGWFVAAASLVLAGIIVAVAVIIPSLVAHSAKPDAPSLAQVAAETAIAFDASSTVVSAKYQRGSGVFVADYVVAIPAETNPLFDSPYLETAASDVRLPDGFLPSTYWIATGESGRLTADAVVGRTSDGRVAIVVHLVRELDDEGTG